MASNSPSHIVEHKPAQDRYELAVDGAVASLDYHFEGACMVITHTFVPPELRGGGIAGELVRAALVDARKAKHRVRSECSYVTAFLKRHAVEYADLTI